MTRTTLSFLVIAVALITLGQLLQKLAADRAGAAGSGSMLLRLARTREAWLAVLCLVSGMAAWLVVLAGMEVSKAYPVLSLSLVLTTIASRWLLHEKLTPRRWAGVGLIAIGVLLVSGS